MKITQEKYDVLVTAHEKLSKRWLQWKAEGCQHRFMGRLLAKNLTKIENRLLEINKVEEYSS